MKKFFYTISVLLLFIPFIPGRTQTIERPARRMPELRIGSNIDKEEKQNLPVVNNLVSEEEMLWERVLYRELDLADAVNATLYYPERPLPEEMNLFCILLEAFLENKLPVYEYLDGYEVFQQNYLLSPKELLDKCNVYYEIEEDMRGNMYPLVDKSDYPSGEIRTYYIKEKWYLSRHSSTLHKKVIAICPLLSLTDERGIHRIPLFWVKYDDLYPFIKDVVVMTSGYNTTKRYTLDDYFVLGMYKGEIIKVVSPSNKTLKELYPDPDSLRMAQEEIERELNTFKKSLSWYPDSVKVSKKQIKKEQSVTSSDRIKPVQKQERPMPTRSVRRR